MGLLFFQTPATLILLVRLAKGKTRQPPLTPRFPTPEMLQTVTILVPALNEEKRISPCLAGLQQQTEEVREIIIIDSQSQDQTAALVKQAMATDSRFQLLEYDPTVDNWVGPSGALHHGFLHSDPASQWILRLDADTRPQPGLVASLVQEAIDHHYDLLSVSTKFILKYPGEHWLHPALLATFAYRFVPVGLPAPSAEQVMANGQCFLCRRPVLEKLDGYRSVRASFCDDVALARYAARQGFKVGFLDGSQLLKVRMYEGAVETWKGLGRSIALREASTLWQMWRDVFFLFLVQGLPLPLTLILLFFENPGIWAWQWLLNVNLLLLLLRLGILWALYSSYDRSQGKSRWLFWFSPLGDQVAWCRVLFSALRKPRVWRGRRYN